MNVVTVIKGVVPSHTDMSNPSVGYWSISPPCPLSAYNSEAGCNVATVANIIVLNLFVQSKVTRVFVSWALLHDRLQKKPELGG